MLEGEPTHAHFDCAATIGADGRLWLFAGRPNNAGGAQKHVESYDFASATWKLEEEEYPYVFGIFKMGVAVLPNSKVNILPVPRRLQFPPLLTLTALDPLGGRLLSRPDALQRGLPV